MVKSLELKYKDLRDDKILLSLSSVIENAPYVFMDGYSLNSLNPKRLYTGNSNNCDCQSNSGSGSSSGSNSNSGQSRSKHHSILDKIS